MRSMGTTLHVKDAFLEVWADTLGSSGVIAAAIVICFTSWTWIDPGVAIAIGLWLLPRIWILLRDTTHILLQPVRAGIELDEVRAAINAVAAVVSTHDLHTWSMSENDISFTANVALVSGANANALRKAIGAMLAKDFEIEHVTIHCEAASCGQEALHP